MGLSAYHSQLGSLIRESSTKSLSIAKGPTPGLRGTGKYQGIPVREGNII